MTKKLFIALANILNENLDENNFVTINKIAVSCADYFAEQNPNFDFQKFIDAVNKENN